MPSWHLNEKQIEALAAIAVMVKKLVQSALGLDYKICKLKENQKREKACVWWSPELVDFQPGTLNIILSMERIMR